MWPIFFIAKRTLLDILRTGVFWVALFIAGFICFSLLFWGWHGVEEAEQHMGPRGPMGRQYSGPDHYDPDDIDMKFDEYGSGFDPMEFLDPKIIILRYTFNTAIGFANLLSIFVMMGLLGREVDRRTVDLLIARPVSRGQIFFGKLFAGWVAITVWMGLLVVWSLFCMILGGMGIEGDFVLACATGILAPWMIGAITLVLTIWLKGFLAGLIAMIGTMAAGTTGLILIKMIGKELLKLDWLVKAIFQSLPPFNVIIKHATDHLQELPFFFFVQDMMPGLAPGPRDGLYSEMWHVYVYLGIVLLAGWLSFFRKQFT